MDVREVVDKIDTINRAIASLESKNDEEYYVDTIVDLLDEYKECLYDLKIR